MHHTQGSPALSNRLYGSISSEPVYVIHHIRTSRQRGLHHSRLQGVDWNGYLPRNQCVYRPDNAVYLLSLWHGLSTGTGRFRTKVENICALLQGLFSPT